MVEPARIIVSARAGSIPMRADLRSGPEELAHPSSKKIIVANGGRVSDRLCPWPWLA